MSNRFHLGNFGFVLLALGLGFAPGAAHAGFQWITPSGSSSSSSTAEAPPPQAEPVSPVGTPEALAPPVIIDSNGASSTPENTATTGAAATTAPAPAPVVVSAPTSEPTTLTPVAPLSEVAPSPAVASPSVSVAPSSQTGPVIIEGTSTAAKTDLPAPVVIQGNNPTSSMAPSLPATGSGVVVLSSGSASSNPIVASPPDIISSPESPAVGQATLAPPRAPAPELITAAPPQLPGPPSATVTLSTTPPGPTPPPAPPLTVPAPTQGLSVTAAPLTLPAPVSTPASVDAVHGFANHVPLAVALRQILPTGYGFSIDQEVDLGVLVSFQGGKPWRETLDETIAPVGLVAHVEGQMVKISYPSDKQSSSKEAPSAEETMPVAPPLSPSPAQEAALAPPTPVPALQDWNAEPGDTLHKVLENWSRRANVEFDWMAEYDYPLQASVHLKGSFEGAVRDLLTGFETAHPQPVAELHTNAKLGQMVLVVTTRGNTAD